MITISVQEEKHRFQQTFHKKKISIGFGSSPDIDLPLSKQGISNLHVVIALHHGKYQVINATHDPLVSLNSLAFGTRNLREGDTIVIHGAILRIDRLRNQPKKIQESQNSSVESLLNQVDSLDQTAPLESDLTSTNPIPLKTYNPIHFAAIVICTLLFLLGSGIYMAIIHDQQGVNESEAALFVADASMALMYAKLYHIPAPRDNWSSPEFLKENFEKTSVFSDSSILSSLSVDGWLKKTPYLIRIYTAQNLNRFLVIAQPSYRKYPFFSSKAAIVLDSNQMELRKLDDIKPLNRILADPKALDSGDTAISTIIDGGKLLSLKAIGQEKKQPQLIPPQGLNLTRPKAEFKVYNTPRYYKLTEWVFEKASKLNISSSNDSSIPPFLTELQTLSPLKDLVYYTTKDVDTALHAYEIFHKYLPKEEMLLGWLSIDPKTDRITGSLLITLKGTPYSQIQSSKVTVTAEPELDLHSRWFEEMIALRMHRTKNLEHISETMTRLIKQYSQEADPNFEGRFFHLQKSFSQIDKEELATIKEKVLKLYQEYRENETNSPNRFLYYARMTGLYYFIGEDLIKQIEQDESQRLSKEKIVQLD